MFIHITEMKDIQVARNEVQVALNRLSNDVEKNAVVSVVLGVASMSPGSTSRLEVSAHCGGYIAIQEVSIVQMLYNLSTMKQIPWWRRSVYRAVHAMFGGVLK